MIVSHTTFSSASDLHQRLKQFLEEKASSLLSEVLSCDEWLLLATHDNLHFFTVANEYNIAAEIHELFYDNGLSTAPAPLRICKDPQKSARTFFEIASGIYTGKLARTHLQDVRNIHTITAGRGGIGPVLSRLFHRSVWLHEKARLETGFFKISLFEEDIIRELSLKIFGSLHDKRVAFIGDDLQMFSACMDSMRSVGCQLFHVYCSSFEDPENEMLKPFQANFFKLNEKTFPLHHCDILIANDSAWRTTIEKGIERNKLFAERKSTPTLYFDVTREKTFKARTTNFYCFSLENFEPVLQHNLALRKSLAGQLNKMVSNEVNDFVQWLKSDKRLQFSGIIGTTEPMQRIFEIISRTAQTNITVLIEGESGTGKELVAKAIHNMSTRISSRFIVVNCGAIPENLLESELFGHEKGAFTGAILAKEGLFETADGGTIFLDEIGELPQQLQVKLLRFLQEGEIKRVGSNSVNTFDVRVLAATNKNLAKLVEENTFRSDLYYRLNVLQLTLPPLRDRKDDIPHLAQDFLKKYALKFQKNVFALSELAKDELIQYDWPGNVRELENVIERTVALSWGSTIERIHLPANGQSKSEEQTVNNVGSMTLRELEKNHILNTMKANDWNYELACQQLGIGRTTLWRKLKEYKLEDE